MGRDSKYCNKKTIKIEDLREKVAPISLEDYFVLRYYKDDVNCETIGKELGISGSSVRRIMNELGIELRNKSLVMKRLHNKTRGRKWTNEQAKKNVSEGVKRSYDVVNGLRELRAETFRKAKEEHKNDQNIGLLVMHALKRTKGQVIK